MKIETDEQFSTLTIQRIQPSDSGKFVIQVDNKLGRDSAFASLTVEGKQFLDTHCILTRRNFFFAYYQSQWKILFAY